jgi:hypothetical protein
MGEEGLSYYAAKKGGAGAFAQREAEQPALNCGAEWYPARDPEGTPATGACWPVYRGFRRVTNPPQVANLPHNFCRIPIRGKTKWRWALSPANRSGSDQELAGEGACPTNLSD